MTSPADQPPGNPVSPYGWGDGADYGGASQPAKPGYRPAALARRDQAQWRTRRLTWLTAGGAAATSLALGVIFAHLLPGHGEAPSARGPAVGSGLGTAGNAPGGSSAPGRGTGGTGASLGGSGQAQPAPPPVPAQAPPQVVTGGS